MAGSTQIAIIGGGAIGASCAYALSRAGHDVLVLDRGAVGQGATAGTACLLTASHATRMASPDALREGLRSLTDPTGTLALRPSPRIAGWLARFTRASLSRDAAHAGTELLVGMALESLALHRAWHAELDTGLVEHGLLNAYLTEEAFEEAQAELAWLERCGVPSQVLDRAGVAALEPAVRGVVGGILCPEDAHIDSLGFAQRVAAGARVLERVEVHRIRPEAGGVLLDTSRGEIRAEQVVVAAGVQSAGFGGDLGLSIPLAGAKGYHVEHSGSAAELHRPVYLAETRVVATPLEGRIRLAGTLELGSAPDAVDLRRVDAIAKAGADHIAGLAGAERTAVWHGLRPMSADGMPIVGRSPRSARVILATGHQMLGITLGPVTGALVARIVAGEELGERLAPLRPGRFRSLRALRR